jgi:hypothetical protein
MVWTTPNEHFKTLADVEFFLKNTLIEINDSLGKLEKTLESDAFEGLATSDWVMDVLAERELREGIILELERRIEKLEAKLDESKE